jgi:phosphinothricin acetyltransferase
VADADDEIKILPLTANDWEAVRSIYAEGIATGNATFETTAPDWSRWDASHLPSCRFVALYSGTVVGWAALSRVSARDVYAGVAEVSVYVGTESRGKGVGTCLLASLIAASESAGIWTLQAGIFPENHASIRLHERCGFRIVGIRERLGRSDGPWRDVALMERRSRTVGA